MTGQTVTIGNEDYRLTFALEDGLSLTSVRNLRTGDEYLKDRRSAYYGNPFTIKLLGENGCHQFLNSGQDFAVTDWSLDRAETGQTLEIQARCTGAPLDVRLRVQVPASGPASTWRMEIRNTSADDLTGEVSFPLLTGLIVGDDLRGQTACTPMQLGGIRQRFADSPYPLEPFVEDYQTTYAGPYALPLVDLLSPSEDEGLFIIVLDPDVRRKSLALTTIGHPHVCVAEVDYALKLAGGESLALPEAMVGVHTGGWDVAVDLYRAWTGDRFLPRDIPTWFREAVALYGVGGVGGGGGFLAHGRDADGWTIRFAGALDSEIASFDELPALLQRARQMGTDVIYLWDFWEGENKTGMPPYWNKGDYVPRSDLGGPAAFRRGVDAVHREGGRVIVYVEGLIVYKNSELGQAHGRDMALQDEHGAYYTDYRNYWSMCPADEAWQRRLAEICVSLVRDMDVDGIFLDSYGAQWNHICANARHSHWPETDVWNQGMTAILSRVRAAVREVKPDAIIMTESTSDLLLPVEDGSCDGSLVWHGPLNGHRLLGSPLKYAFPEANIFSNGYTLAQLNQVFALGGNLAVGPKWEEHADYIRTLVALKREWKDALIYGQMLPSPRTTSPDVVAAAFRGERNAVVTVVNTGVAEIGAEVQLPAELAFLSWRSPLTEARVQVDAKSPVRTLSVTLRPGELQVWLGEG